jgi:pyrroloquinoline quinone biosynthesis protein B
VNETLPRAVVLGTAQDGGFPHAGCRCDRCARARIHRHLSRRIACLGLVDGDGRGFLVDATPDLPDQIEALPDLSGLLLTHAHMGHIAGLLWLGTEAMAVEGLPLHGGRRLVDFLAAHEPWASLIRDGRLVPQILEPDREVALGTGLALTPVPVPHRAEWSETFGFRIAGPNRTLLWLPDIDRFGAGALRALLDGVDDALIDGTFLGPDELPGRDLTKIPHPFMTETLDRLAALGPSTRISFVHLNHSNPVILADSEESREFDARFREAGLAPVGRTAVAADGEEIAL